MSTKVIIIGSGIGGLCVGIRLLSQGYDVEIYEKEKNPGGVVGEYKKDNLKFDLTASIAINPAEYDQIFYDVNLNPRDYFDFYELECLYKVFFESGKTFHVYKDIDRQKNEVNSIFDIDFNNYKQVIDKLYGKYKIADKYFLTQSFYNNKNVFHFFTLINALKLKPFHTVNNQITKFISDKELANLLSFQSMYMGYSPLKMVNVYATVPALSQVKGIKHINGGMAAYTQSLVKAFYEFGGKLYCNKKVDEIIISNKKACGIRIEKEIIKSDIVISNADFCYTVSNLIKDAVLSNKYHSNKLKNIKLSCSVFILRVGVKGKFDNLGVHNIYICNDFKGEIDKIFNGHIPNNPPVYIYYPSIVDDSFTVDGVTTMNIMIRVPNLKDCKFNYDDETIKILRSICIHTISTITNCDDIEKNIVYEDILTPMDLESQFNCYYGEAFGLAHSTLQSICFRPQATYKAVKNLYFTGSSIHPGNGVTMVMKGAKITADMISKSGKGKT